MRTQMGFSLIEVLLAIAILGIIVPVIPAALSVANRTTMISNEHTVAESLARSQMDYVQNQSYDSQNSTPEYLVLPDLPVGYSIVTPMATRLDPLGDGTARDDNLQRITVTVKRGTKTLYTLVSNKVNFKPPGAIN
jgi:prepilin-type N-terminal cleavage/methylation domain-containing protein